jgi:hypothetical protein
MSGSTPPRYFSRSVLELRRDEATTSALQIEAHLQVAQVMQFPESRDIFVHSACQVPDNVSRDSSPDADVEEDMIPPVRGYKEDFTGLEVTVVDIEHSLTHIIHFVCPQNIMKI